MILLALLVLCIASVPLAGGRLGRLSTIQFKRPAAGVAALVMQFSIMRLFPEGAGALHAVLHLVSYALLFYFLAANLSLPGLWLIGLGGAMNGLAIAANDGVMPAQPSALSTAGIVAVPGEFTNSGAVENPKLWFLGDIFALPANWPLANVFSIGDVVLILGAFVLLHRVSGSALARYIAAFARWADRSGPRLELIREQRAFRRLWLAQGISSVGDWVYPLAAFTLVIEGGGNASSLAFLLIASAGPGMLIAIFGAPLIDRFSRKRMMVWTDIGRGLALATLLLVESPSLLHLYAVAVAIGLGSSLNQPAFLASLPNILPRSLLAAANSLVAITISLSIVIGMGLGGFLVDTFGVHWGFTANALSFLFSAGLVAGTAMPKHLAEATDTMVRELVIGFRYVTGNKQIFGVLVVLGLITLAAGMKQALEPLFAFRTLDGGTTGVGLVNMVWGVGMLVGGFFAASIDRRMGHGPLLTWSTLLAGVAIVTAAGMPSLAPVLVLWVFGGIANTFGTVAYETLVQEQTPDAVRGRVFAALEAAIQGGLIAGLGLAAAAGAIFDESFAARGGLVLAGLIFVLAGIASWRLLHPRGVPAPFAVRSVELVPAGARLALLRVDADGMTDVPPVLLVDDGTRVHRIDPLPSPDGRGLAYGVPQALVALRRAALALEVRGRGLLDLSLPAPLPDA